MHAKHAIWIALALSATASAQIYRCDGPSGPVFSQTPCAPDAAQIQLDVSRPDAENAAALEQETQARREAQALRLEHDRHEREIVRLRAALRNAEADRDAEIARVDAQRARAANNLAGATWLQALSNDESAIIARYEPRLQKLRDDIAEMERTRP